MSHFSAQLPQLGRSDVALLRGETEADMTRADLIRTLMNTALEEHRNLTREQARVIVNEIFAAIAQALRNGEVVRLPVGNFGVYEQERQPLRRWFLGRVRVTYKQRNVINFIGGEYDLEPTNQPPHILDSKGEMKASENNATPKISPKEQAGAGIAFTVALHSARDTNAPVGRSRQRRTNPRHDRPSLPSAASSVS